MKSLESLEMLDVLFKTIYEYTENNFLKHEIYTHYYEIVTVHENWLASSVIHSSL